MKRLDMPDHQKKYVEPPFLSLTYHGLTHQEVSIARLKDFQVPDDMINNAIDKHYTQKGLEMFEKIAGEFFTDSPGLSAAYQQEYLEALRYKNANSPAAITKNDYPYLFKLLDHRATSYDELADMIIQKGNALNGFGSDFAEKRVALPALVKSAATIKDKVAVIQQSVNELMMLAKEL